MFFSKLQVLKIITEHKNKSYNLDFKCVFNHINNQFQNSWESFFKDWPMEFVEK